MKASVSSRARQERRRAQRAPLHARVECKTAETYILGQCQDISEMGMLVKAPQTFDISRAVALRFVLPAIPTVGLPVQANGIVVRAQDAKYMAIEFVGLKPFYRSAVAKFVERTKETRSEAS